MSILFLACLLAICLPILSVQIPRFFPSLFSFSSSAENGSSLPKRPPPLRRRVRQRGAATAPRSEAQQGRREATDGADSYTGGEETGSEEIHVQPSSTRLLMLEKDKGKGRADGKVGRKPWDPPFPRCEALQEKEGEETKGSVWVMPPTPPKKTGREMEAKGVAVRLFPPDVDGDDGYVYEQEEREETLEQPEAETTPKLTPASAPAIAPAPQTSAHPNTSRLAPAPAKRKGKAKSGVMSAMWICVAILAVLLLILAFAILVAHCLAWFLVYKTEARLGEARRGILQGGEMRLCLCAT